MWITLSIVAVVALVLYWRGPNAVWGLFTIGLIGGLVAATIYFLKGDGFHWFIVRKWVVLCVLLGFVIEIIGILPGMKAKKSK